MSLDMKKNVTRRRFIVSGVSAGAALGLGGWYFLGGPEPPGNIPGPRPSQKVSASKAPRVIVISIDSLDPRYLYLDSHGNTGGRDGDWLMPNVRRFLDDGAWFKDTRCQMPAITDPNHLNAVAGGSIAQTGINCVSLQFFNWQEDGQAKIVSPHLSFARDDQGRPVDTLFSAWKRKWPQSRTFYISGKEWVARMFDHPGAGVDMIIGGSRFPSYVEPPPRGYRFFDPPGDIDRQTDYETPAQTSFSRVAYEKNASHFPPDMWTVNTTLEVLNREMPDFGVVILAQSDDLQHGLGAAWNPSEFEAHDEVEGAELSRINHKVCRGAVLDGMRDVDGQFGRLLEGIKKMPNYRDATLVLYSDHDHITHRNKE